VADFEHRDNSGSLFVNERKTRDNHPDRTGGGKILCPHCHATSKFRISGWVKPGTNGRENWLSVAFTAEEGDGGSRPASATRDTGDRPVAVTKNNPSGRSSGDVYDDIDDPIPF
jgi:hypothetical protein